MLGPVLPRLHDTEHPFLSGILMVVNTAITSVDRALKYCLNGKATDRTYLQITLPAVLC